MIHVNDLTKHYGEVKALDGVTFDIKKGEIVGLLGPNGAGKTTCLKILTCYMPATNGKANVANFDCALEPLDVKRRIGYLPETNPLYPEMNVLEYLEYIGRMHDIPNKKLMERIIQVVKDCGLKEKLKQDISELSKGYKQRVGLASALIHNPDVLILDEPTSGLDPNQIAEIRGLIKNIGQEKTVILSSHILSEVQATCSRVLIINKGKIVAQGSPEELASQSQGVTVIEVKIKGDREIAGSLQNIEGVTSIKEIPDNEYGTVSYSIETDPSTDPRIAINHAILDAGHETLELCRKDVSLEDVFARLTKK